MQYLKLIKNINYMVEFSLYKSEYSRAEVKEILDEILSAVDKKARQHEVGKQNAAKRKANKEKNQ